MIATTRPPSISKSNTTWKVVPESGSGELEGFAGEGGWEWKAAQGFRALRSSAMRVFTSRLTSAAGTASEIGKRSVPLETS